MESKDLTHACFLSAAICDSVYNYTIGDNPIVVQQYSLDLKLSFATPSPWAPSA